LSSELLFSRLGGRTSAALRENGVTVELRVEDDGVGLAAGRIVKARVSKILPGIQSAFLDVGQERDAFLHVADLLLPGEVPPGDPGDDSLDVEPDDDVENEAAAAVVRPPRRNVPPGLPIQDRLKEGRDLVVQVAREGFGGKGPRVTSYITFPGRYLVYAPRMPFRGVSRRIGDAAERHRLREILAGLPEAPGGFIVRTAGAGATAAAFEADARRLVGTWREVEQRAARAAAPAVVHTDLDLFLRTIRDTPTESLDRIVVDDEAMYRAGREFLADLDPALAARLVRHLGEQPLFDATGVTQDVEKALRPRVWLKSGGTLVIQQTEALVSIDVNTGKFVGSRHPEETVLKTNLEAAGEIARQLRLRDLGGIIVVDFIDMDLPEHKRAVIDALENALRRDRSRTKVVGLSELGLLQLTRKRTRPGLDAVLTQPCPSCSGSGRVRTPETVALDALLEVRRVAAAFAEGPLTVRVHPDVARALRLALQTTGPILYPAIADRLRIADDPEVRFDQFDVSAV
jgi:ribonuclease G